MCLDSMLSLGVGLAKCVLVICKMRILRKSCLEIYVPVMNISV